jgi:hypothetical protein
MKVFLMFTFLTLNIASYAQGKLETVNWINSKLSNGEIVRKDKIQSLAVNLKIFPDGRFKTTIFTWLLKPNYAPNFKNYSRKTIFNGNFKNLSPNSVRVEKTEKVLYLYASCSGKNFIMQQYDENTNDEGFRHSDVLLGAFTNDSMEPRFKKAIIHLIKLFGGKSEPF